MFGDWRVIALLALAFYLAPGPLQAHGFAGKRFFPATLTVDDPFVADEADLMFSRAKLPDEAAGNAQTNGLDFEWSKRLTRNFGLSFGGSYLHLNPRGVSSMSGFDNFSLGAKYLLKVSPRNERLISAGLDVDMGGTGSRHVGAETFSRFTPTVYFGQGLGNLPGSLRFLRPLAVTGAFGPSFPTRGGEPTNLDWGITIMYDIHYLQSFVRYIGIPAPFDHVIPVVEFPMETCMNTACSGHTTGTVNPGFMWFTHWGQIGLEARVPVNRDSGIGTGFLAQIHLYLDDVFPRTLGKPLLH